jgi:cysteine synthase A
MPRAIIYSDVVQTTFDTPLVKLNRIIPREHATVLVKLEFFNPLSSVKDRIGRAMIEAAEHARILTKNTHIIEPTSGNTGVALAFVAAAKGYRLTIVMPESMSLERRALLQALGANLVLTSAQEGMRGAVVKAQELVAKLPNSWMPQQFENPTNPAIHETTTGPEIWTDTQGKVDIFVAGVGTGGTITGVTRFLRSRKPDVKAIAVEPADSAVISGGKPGPHKIQGIGAGFIPKNLDTSLLNGVETVTNDEAFAWARRLAKEEGILAGITSGANVAVAARLAARPENQGKVIVTVAASSGERYLSTPLFQLNGQNGKQEQNEHNGCQHTTPATPKLKFQQPVIRKSIKQQYHSVLGYYRQTNIEFTALPLDFP